MNRQFITVITILIISISGYQISNAQFFPEYLDCTSEVDSLCVNDENVRLPANNQFYLGEGHPDAISCSVHITQRKRVVSPCGDSLQYEVLLFLNDTSQVIILKSLSTIAVDTSGEAELTFNTEETEVEAIRHAGMPYTTGCSDHHLIKWVVLDSCGVLSICEQRLYLYDCMESDISQNTNKLYIIPVDWSAYAHIEAKDFVFNVADDCVTQDSFLYSLEPDFYQPDTSVFGCDLPSFGVEELLNIWIADNGKDINCDGQISWSERNVFEQTVNVVYTENGWLDCEPVGNIIEGKVNIEDGRPVKGVEITCFTPGSLYPTYVTTQNGQYSFYLEAINGYATVSAVKDDMPKNGVNTLDLVRIQKHLLGIEPFTSPYKFIAADANNSQHVSAIDLIELRKLILGRYTELPGNESWRFVPAAYVFGDTIQPGLSIGSITFTDLANPGNLDFIGIKIGDVNNTVQPNFNQLLTREALPLLELIADQQEFVSGEIIDVPVRISSDQSLIGLQFTLAAKGLDLLAILPGRIPIAEEHYAMFGDKTTISWFDENTLDASAGDILLTVRLQAKSSGILSQSVSINSSITEAEIYNADEETFIPTLRIQQDAGDDALAIISCNPNPWNDQTTISFQLPETGKVSFTLCDATGNELLFESKMMNQGIQSHTISSASFAEQGLVILKITSEKHTATQRLLVLE